MAYLDSWNRLVPNGLPSLENPVRFHGGFFYGDVSPWLRVGLKGYGGQRENKTDTGLTRYGGGIVGFFGEFKKNLIGGLYVAAGLTISCGRFEFASSNRETGAGMAVYSVSMYLEPEAGLGYVFFDIVELLVRYSYVFRTFDDSEFVGVSSADKGAYPVGQFITFGLAYRFGYLSGK